MNIRPLVKTDEARAKEIWKICFGDSDAFIEKYFDEIVRYEDTLGYYEESGLIADLFMLKFQAKLAGADFETEFLAGCATLPRARKRGLMRELVQSAMLDMKRRGLAVTYLHPFLHAFYRRFGYETVAYIKRRSLAPCLDSKGKRLVIYSKMDKIPWKEMELAYGRYIGGFDNAFSRSGKRFNEWLRLLFADQGYAVVSEAWQGLSYALYYMEEDTADVFELVCPGERERGILLNSIPAKRVNYFIPSGNDGEAEEFTMMRVLSPASLLEKIPVHRDFTIEIEDDFLGERYNLKIGKLPDGRNRVEEGCGAADISLAIGELAQAAAGAFPPGSGLEEYFSRQTASFFETY